MAPPSPDRHPARVVSTDAGIDDALALLLLDHFAEPPVEAIIASGGNVSVDHVAANCAHLKERFGIGGRLWLGTDPPPVGDGDSDAAHVHGPTGLGPFRSPPAELPPLDAFIRDGAGLPDFDLLVLGPATDAARLLRDERMAGRIRSVTVMGGAFEPRAGVLGNVTPWAEFNAYMDPGALQETAEACDAQFVPLDATEQRLFTVAELAEGLSPGEDGDFVRGLLEFTAEAHLKLGCGRGVFMHDAIAAAVWLGLIQTEWRETHLAEVVTEGERRGMTRADDRAPVRIRYARRVDMGAFLTLWHHVVRAL